MKKRTSFAIDDDATPGPSNTKAPVKKKVSIFMDVIKEENEGLEQEDEVEEHNDRGEDIPRKFTGETNTNLGNGLNARRSSVYIVSKGRRASEAAVAKYTDRSNRPVLDEWEERRASIYVFATPTQWLPRRSISATGQFLMRVLIYSRAVSRKAIWRTLGITLFILFNVYLSFVITRNWGDEYKGADAHLLVYIVLTIYVVIIYQLLIRTRVFRPISYKVKRYINSVRDTNRYRYTIIFTWFLVYLGIIIFLIIDTYNERLRLVSATGILVIVLFGYIFSKDRRKVRWRPVLWGILMQYIFGLLCIRWRKGRIVMEVAEKLVSSLLEHTDYGSQAVYGYLVKGNLAPGISGNANPQNSIFAFQSLTVMIFVSMWLAVLYHYGLMQKLIMKVGWVLEVTTGTTACESMAVAANMTLAIPTSFLTIKPYLSVMTESELHTVIASGLATIPGNLLGAYTQQGVHAADLMSKMVMSAGASLAFTKLFYPETGKSRTNVWNIIVYKGEHRSALEAAVSGAIGGMDILMRISFGMIAFGSFISFLNSIPNFFGELVGVDHLTLKWLFSKLFLPVAYIMGVNPEHCEEVAWLVGINLVFSNTSAFKVLKNFQDNKQIWGRSELIATYAICGYYTVSSIGIVLGSLGSLVPDRRSEISAVVVRGIISGASICFMTACVAGSLGSDSDVPPKVVDELKRTSFSMRGYWGDMGDDLATDQP